MSRICLVISLSPEGLVNRLVSTGHALRSGFDSIPCALVSAQLRSFGVLVSGKHEIQVRGRLDSPGSFGLELIAIEPVMKNWYRGASDLLVRALSDINRDFPDQVQLTIEAAMQEI